MRLSIANSVRLGMLTCHEALQILDDLRSAQDPIIVRGEETTPERVLSAYHSNRAVPRTRIGYYTLRGWVRRGTFAGMIRDRRWTCGQA